MSLEKSFRVEFIMEEKVTKKRFTGNICIMGCFKAIKNYEFTVLRIA